MRFGHSPAIIVLSIAFLALLSPLRAATATSIVEAKLAADGTPVSITGAIVTATSSTLFYIEGG